MLLHFFCGKGAEYQLRRRPAEGDAFRDGQCAGHRRPRGSGKKEIYTDFDSHIDKLYALNKLFVEGVQKLDEVWVNGRTGRDSAPHVVSVTFPGIRSEVLLHALEDKGIYVSSGSACATNKPAVSATLKAIGMPKEGLDSTLRFSFSVFTTEEEIRETLSALNELVPMLRRYRRS